MVAEVRYGQYAHSKEWLFCCIFTGSKDSLLGWVLPHNLPSYMAFEGIPPWAIYPFRREDEAD